MDALNIAYDVQRDASMVEEAALARRRAPHRRRHLLLSTVIFLDGERVTDWVAARSASAPRRRCVERAAGPARAVPARGASARRAVQAAAQREAALVPRVVASTITTLLWIARHAALPPLRPALRLVQQDVRHDRRRDRRCSPGCTTRCSSSSSAASSPPSCTTAPARSSPTKGEIYLGRIVSDSRAGDAVADEVEPGVLKDNTRSE